MPRTVPEIAYDEAVRAINDLASVLDDLRGRAGTMLAAAALVTSFLGSTSLGRSPLGGLAWTALACFLASALLTLVIVWPFRWNLTLSAYEILVRTDASPEDVERELALRHEANYDANLPRLWMLLSCFRAAIVFLVLEVAFWTIDLWRT